MEQFPKPFVHKGGHLDSTIFKYFPVGISVRNLHYIWIHLVKTTLIQQKEPSKMFRFKMAAKNEFSFRENSHATKIWNNILAKEFCNKIWLNVGEHEYIYIL